MRTSHHATVQAILSRRNLLKHTALAALLTPVIRMRDAAAAPAPRRVILVYSGNGAYEFAGPATGSETDFSLLDWWKPLERHKADGIFMSHMAATGSNVVSGSGHALGGQMFSGYGNIKDSYRNAGETIDQVIAKRLETEKRQGVMKSLIWGVAGLGAGEAFSAGSNRDIAPELSPQNAWKTLFAQFVPSDAGGAKAAAAMLARKKSLLDFVSKDCASLSSALGSEGSKILAEHCATVRSMEQAVNLTPAVVCTNPKDPGSKSWSDPENGDVQVNAFIDLMATALACELTHVVGFQLSGQGSRNRLAASYGVPSSPTVNSGDSGPAHHPWTHMPASAGRTKALQIFINWYSTKVALLIDKLKTTRDASGKPLLDSTVVLWLSELGGNTKCGDAHMTGCIPAVMFGNGQGTFKTGRYLRGVSPETPYQDLPKQQEAGADMAKVLVSMVQYMGLTDVKTVGATGVNGPYTRLMG